MTTRQLLDEAQTIKALARRIHDLEAKLGRTGTLAADTGWTDVSAAANWGTGTIKVRKVGAIVVLTFSVEIGTTSSGAVLCTLPAEFRPTIQIQGAGVSNSGGGVPVQAIVGTDGEVDIFYPAGPGSANTVRGNLTWPV